MNIQFEKWHGSGNDFILVDDRQGELPRNKDWIRQVCSRHVGIGSDGIIFIKQGADYEMDFYNPDGSQSFCGNGSRCAFAYHSKLVGDRGQKNFLAIDGTHEAAWEEDRVKVKMRPSSSWERINDQVDLINTGSPHLLVWGMVPAEVDIVKEAHAYRYNDRFTEEGVNVNFLKWHGSHLEMRTYERGVENETLSCGTGVTAAALSAMWRGHVRESCQVETRGGTLKVHVGSMQETGATKIFLEGSVQFVYSGTIAI